MSPNNFQQTMDHAIALNNSGAYYTANGNISDAMRSYRAALQTTRRLKSFVGASINNDRGGRTSQYCMLDELMTPMTTSSDKNMSSTSKNQTVIYEHPMQFPTTINAADKSSNDIFLALSTATVFNLALCHHQAAMMNSTSSSISSTPQKVHNAPRQEYLRKAVKLYESAFRIAQKTYGFLNGQCNFFFSATLNNMAMIFQDLGETHLAERCFHQLLTMLVHYNETPQPVFGQSGANAYHASHSEGFFRSAIMYVAFPRCSFPAAAA